MLRHSLVLAVAAASAVLVGAALATTGTAEAPMLTAGIASTGAGAAKPLACAVRETEMNGVRVLEAVAEGGRAAKGDYRFAVTSRSAAGSSRSSQNGTFEMKPNRPVVLGEIGVNAAAGYEAELILDAAGHEITCAAEG